MPANKNVITRYKILDELLSDYYHDYSLNDLVNEVSDRLAEFDSKSDGVVRRTIEKDVKYLKEGPFAADIERYSVECYDKEKQRTVKKQCLRYSDPSFSIFKTPLSNDEEYLLREALSLLGQFDGLPNLDKLESLRLGLNTKNDERKIISFTKNPIQGSSSLGTLFTAISEKSVVEICYHTFSHPEENHSIILHPYLLKEYNRRWFVFGAAECDMKLLCFGLERIDRIKFLPSYAYQEYHGNINDIFEDIIGVTFIEKNPTLSILFWVSNHSKDYVLTKPLHDSQIHYTGIRSKEIRDKYTELPEGDFFRIECKENYELLRELSSFGEDLIVLKPSSIQNKIIERINKMQAMYARLRND